jgi:hypothetical protein
LTKYVTAAPCRSSSAWKSGRRRMFSVRIGPVG